LLGAKIADATREPRVVLTIPFEASDNPIHGSIISQCG